MEKIINYFGIRKRITLSRINSYGIVKNTFMEAITDDKLKEIQEAIDSNDSKTIIKLSDDIEITSGNIVLYGDININNKEDIKFIQQYKLLHLDDVNFIPVGFDYKKGTASTIDGVIKTCPTFDSVKWFMYNYCLIGKPEKIVIYKISKR